MTNQETPDQIAAIMPLHGNQQNEALEYCASGQCVIAESLRPTKAREDSTQAIAQSQ